MKQRIILLAFLLASLHSPTFAQEEVAIYAGDIAPSRVEVESVSVADPVDSKSLKYMEMLDLSTIRKNLETLASKEYMGRSPGQEGGKLTQEFLKKQFSTLGIELPSGKSYAQDIGRFSGQKSSYRFNFDGYNYEDDYGYTNSFQKDSIISTNDILFLGYGDYSATINNFAGVDISDKVVMFLEGTSTNKWGIPYTVNNTNEKYLLEKKPKAIISIRDGFSSYFSVYTGTYFNSDERRSDRIDDISPKITVNERLANKLLEKSGKTVKSLKQEIEETGYIAPIVINSEQGINIKSQLSFEDSKAQNIIGIIEGTDLKDEYIVVMAHHDHLGKSSYSDYIYFGADDNASGVSATLEMARILAKAKKEKHAPRRSIIILFPTSEEEGLKGAEFYAKNPLYPIKQTKACVNLDMVGRKDNSNSSNDNYVYISKNEESDDLATRIHQISLISALNTETMLTDRNFSRSDHYVFSKASVPSVMITGGEHDDYHSQRDTASAIDYDLLFKRTKLAFLTIWDLANPPK